MKKYLKQISSDFIKNLMRGTADSFFMEWDNDEIEFEGAPDEFHNFAADLARSGFYGRACMVLESGINTYCMDTVLLADFLNYGIKCNRIDTCNKYFELLNKIDDKKKDWRAFDFSIDYLLFLIKRSGDDEEMKKLKETALDMVSRFKYSVSNEELAYLAEYQIYESTFEKSIGLKKLEQFLNDENREAKVAPKCHLKYIEEMLNMGEYSQVILYANDGAAEAAQEQEGVDTGYFFYALALAKDALWLKADKGKVNADRDEANEILKYYQTAYDTLDENKQAYFKVISKRFKIIANIAEINRSLNEWREKNMPRNVRSFFEKQDE